MTNSKDSPLGSSNRSKYSVTTASALYGTPFLRRYPGFILVVTTFKEPPGGGPPRPAPITLACLSQVAIETPCQSPPWLCEGLKPRIRVWVPASVSSFRLSSSCQVRCRRL